MLQICKDFCENVSNLLLEYGKCKQLYPLCQIDFHKPCSSFNCLPNNFIDIKVFFKTSENIQFDFRFSFNNQQLKHWWPHLNQIVLKLSEQTQISNCTVHETSKSIDVLLNRSEWITKIIQTSKQIVKNENRQIVLMKICKKFSNYFTNRRIELISTIVDKLAKEYFSNVYGLNRFEQFVFNSLKQSQCENILM